MKKNFNSRLVKAIKLITKKKKSYLHEPHLDESDIQEVKKCIKTSFVSSISPQVNLFEKSIAKITKSKYVIATVNGTSAIHTALKLFDIKSTDEVLMPSLNFVSSANAVKYCSATPHFVEINKKNLSVDIIKLENYLKKISLIKKNHCFNKKTKRRIKALVVVHLFGYSGNLNKINALCKKFKLKLIEDAAEAFGSYFKKKHLGTFGDLGVLSFNGNKILTTGGGGAILTSNLGLARKASSLINQSKIPHKWETKFSEIGYNYRLPGLNAALGLSQIKKFKKILKAKKKLNKKYRNIFKNFKEFEFFTESKDCSSNHWLNTIILKTNSMSLRNTVLKKLNNSGIQARPCWKLLHKHKQFFDCPKMELKITEKLEKKIINIPSSPMYGLND